MGKYRYFGLNSNFCDSHLSVCLSYDFNVCMSLLSQANLMKPNFKSCVKGNILITKSNVVKAKFHVLIKLKKYIF